LPSGGGSGIVKGGDQGEFAHARVSVHVFICSGLNATADVFPRYTIHDNRRPGPLEGTIDDGGRYTRFAMFAGWFVGFAGGDASSIAGLPG